MKKFTSKSLAIYQVCLFAFLFCQNADLEKKRFAYVSNLMSHTVSKIDLDDTKWLYDLDFGKYPIFSSIHPHDKTKMILALHNYERESDEDFLLLIDLKTEKIIKKVPYPGSGMPSGFVYDSKRDRIYVADENLHKIFVHDGTTLDYIFDFPAGLIPVHVDISPDCKWLAATNRKSADLYVYDLDNIQRSAKYGIYTIHTGSSPGLFWDPEDSTNTKYSHPIDIKFSNNSNLCYVTDYSTKELLYIDITKQEIIHRIKLDKTPFDLTLNRDKSLAYVCNIDGDSISVIDLVKKKIIAKITDIQSNPIHCELDEEKQQLIVACWGGGKNGGIWIVDIKTYKTLKNIVPEGAKASIGITIIEK